MEISYFYQILCEINFGDSGSAKSAILTHSEAVKSAFKTFLHFLKAAIHQMNKNLEPLKMAKTADLELLDSPKLISRKI